MMDIILHLYKRSKEVIASGKSIQYLIQSGLYEKVIKIKYDVSNDHLEKLEDYFTMIDETIAGL